MILCGVVLAAALAVSTFAPTSRAQEVCVRVESGQAVMYPCKTEVEPLWNQLHNTGYDNAVHRFLAFYKTLPENVFKEHDSVLFYDTPHLVITVNSQEAFELHQHEFLKHLVDLAHELLIASKGPLTQIEIHNVKLYEGEKLHTLSLTKDTESDNIILSDNAKTSSLTPTDFLKNLEEYFNFGV